MIIMIKIKVARSLAESPAKSLAESPAKSLEAICD
jgi:hypothetical protein